MRVIELIIIALTAGYLGYLYGRRVMLHKLRFRVYQRCALLYAKSLVALYEVLRLLPDTDASPRSPDEDRLDLISQSRERFLTTVAEAEAATSMVQLAFPVATQERWAEALQALTSLRERDVEKWKLVDSMQWVTFEGYALMMAKSGLGNHFSTALMVEDAWRGIPNPRVHPEQIEKIIHDEEAAAK